MDYLLERIEELERTNRRLRGLMVISLIAAMILIWIACAGWARSATAQAVPDVKVVRAQQFVVEDAQGRARAVLGTTGDDASLTFTDEKGNLIVAIGRSGARDAGVSVHAADGSIAALFAPRRGRARIGVIDPQGRELSLPPR